MNNGFKFVIWNKKLFGVAIGYSWAKLLILEERIADKNGQVLQLDVTIDEQIFELVNVYNANTEKDQLNTIKNWVSSAKQKNLGADFYLSFDFLLKS